MNVPPITPATAAAFLRAQILGAAEAELIAVLSDVQDVSTTPPHAGPASAPDPVRQAVDVAKATAAGQQGGLAPLLADLVQAQSAPALTPAVKTAIDRVLAIQTPLEGLVTGDAVEQAVAQSGLFLEAHLAAAPQASRTVAPAPPDLKAALLNLGRALAAEPVAEVATPPQPVAAPARGAPPAPEPRLAALPHSPDLPAIVQHLRPLVDQAVARLVVVPPASTSDEPSTPLMSKAATAPQADLTPLLADLAQAQAAPRLPVAIKAAIDLILALRPPQDDVATAKVAAPAVAEDGPLPLARLARAEPAPEATPRDLKTALLTLQRALAAVPAAEVSAPPPQRIPPPVRGAALTAQAPAPATLLANADLPAIIQHLRPQVEQAVARQVLHQLASVPDGSATTAWLLELPIATPQGSALAQFEIDRDSPPSGAADGPPMWQLRFAIDVEPLGPVHVHLRTDGEHTAVSVWADRDESLARLRGEASELAQALPADVTFHRGAPRRPIPARGRFVDRTS